MRGSAEGLLAILLFVLWLPYKLIEAMIAKYHKDGFFGLIKNILGWLFAIVAVVSAYGFYGLIASDTISEYYSLLERATHRGYRWEQDIEDAKGILRGSAAIVIILLTSLYLSIKLIISSSNRSRALAKAEKEIIPNE